MRTILMVAACLLAVPADDASAGCCGRPGLFGGLFRARARHADAYVQVQAAPCQAPVGLLPPASPTYVWPRRLYEGTAGAPAGAWTTFAPTCSNGRCYAR